MKAIKEVPGYALDNNVIVSVDSEGLKAYKQRRKRFKNLFSLEDKVKDLESRIIVLEQYINMK